MRTAGIGHGWLFWVALVGLVTGVGAQTLVPEGAPGSVAYIAYPRNMVLDGLTDDWRGLPVTTVTTGPALSTQAAENGSFRFSLAADAQKLYILMTSVDQTLITGQHGADSWNEDSLEFYLNFGPSFSLTKYNNNVVQYRVLPSDMGNPDPRVLNLSGTNLATAPLEARVFRTEDGWGFEGSVSLVGKLEVAHGVEVGFQAQSNGALVKDRNVKLIWSKYDTADNSWQNPSLFGRGIFYEVGQTDLPQPSITANSGTTEAVPPVVPVIRSEVAVNQVGYFPRGIKTGTLAQSGTKGLEWSLIDADTLTPVAQGQTRPGGDDAISGDTVHTADFSAVTAEGTYRLVIDGRKSSPFRIGNDVVSALRRDALAYFYLNRSGIALTAERAGAAWARPAGHLSDAQIPAYQMKGVTVNGLGGWYDAGDFGKYVVNGGIAVWTLQNAYERAPQAFGEGTPAILDEARWEMEFLLKMQVPEGQPLAGLAFHKLHDLQWSGVPTALNTHETRERYAFQPTTAATLNLAATAAQAARLWMERDQSFANRALAVARSAWKAALAHPAVFAGNVPGSGGGNYEDATVSDEFFWAAAELFATTGGQEYWKFLSQSPWYNELAGADGKVAASMSWGDTAALGTLSLLASRAKLPGAELNRLKAQVIAAADRYRSVQTAQGYRVPLDASGYVWGSSSVVLNNALILATAFDLTGTAGYRDGVVQSLDYLLGHNALGKSFVSGYGADSLAHPHHRVWGNDPGAGYPPPPPGAIAGGPNASIQDPDMTAANLAALPIAKRYLDQIGSYATNEVAINWNAPLVWVSSWLDQQYNLRP